MTSFEAVKADCSQRMDKALEVLKKEFAGLRTGRAAVSMLDPVMVEAYGSLVPLLQVGSVSVPEPRLLCVQVWDKGLVKFVEKAIRESGLGLNPMNDGQVIRLPIPPLTEERRLELAKVAGKYTEQAKVVARNVRREGIDATKKMQKDNLISQDDQKRYEEEIQKLTDAIVKHMDEALKIKETEIKQV